MANVVYTSPLILIKKLEYPINLILFSGKIESITLSIHNDGTGVRPRLCGGGNVSVEIYQFPSYLRRNKISCETTQIKNFMSGVIWQTSFWH